jgi:hypothetical protein
VVQLRAGGGGMRVVVVVVVVVVGPNGSLRWKLRWQPQAAHLREVGS